MNPIKSYKINISKDNFKNQSKKVTYDFSH